MSDYVTAAACCIRAASHGHFIAGLAYKTSADKSILYYRADASAYAAHKSLIDACRCEEGEPEPEPLKDVIVPVPRSQWPLWVSVVAMKRADGEAGVGDTVKRLLNITGLAFKALLKSLGTSCNCDVRQANLNARFPY